MRLSLDLSFVPERKRDQAEKLAGQILAARKVPVDQAAHDRRGEEALAAKCVGRKYLARERLELAAQPGGGRYREAALASVHDLARDERRGSPAQEHFLSHARHLQFSRKRQGETADDGIEEGHARFERVCHRGAVGLDQQVVDQRGAEIDVLQA